MHIYDMVQNCITQPIGLMQYNMFSFIKGNCANIYFKHFI